MATGNISIVGLLRLLLGTLVLLFALCTAFAAVVTVVVAWQEERRSHWPQATARIVKIDITRASTNGGRRMYIRCRLSYAAGAEQHGVTVYSRQFAAPEVAQYPAHQDAPYIDWVNEHPPGSTIVVRYDPENPNKSVLAEEYMPGGGPQTRNNVKLLEFFAGGFVVLFAIARITWPQALLQNRSSSMPPDS